MTQVNERAKFSLADGRIEIEGSEAFVSAQLAKLEPVLVKMFEQRTSAPPTSASLHSSASNHGQASGSNGHGSSMKLDEYLNVFALADGKVQILKTLPGSGKAAKTLNAALLLAFANELNGRKSTNMEEVRATCTSHACIDIGNFSKPFKGAAGKEAFTISGSGATQSITLTHPGKTKAKAIADSLNK